MHLSKKKTKTHLMRTKKNPLNYLFALELKQEKNKKKIN